MITTHQSNKNTTGEDQDYPALDEEHREEAHFLPEHSPINTVLQIENYLETMISISFVSILLSRLELKVRALRQTP